MTQIQHTISSANLMLCVIKILLYSPVDIDTDIDVNTNRIRTEISMSLLIFGKGTYTETSMARTYTETSMAQTLMAPLSWLRPCSRVPWETADLGNSWLQIWENLG